MGKERGSGGETGGAEKEAPLAKALPQMIRDEDGERDGGEHDGDQAKFDEPLPPTALGVQDDAVFQLEGLVEREDLLERIDAVAEERGVFPHGENVVPDLEAHGVGNHAGLLRMKARKHRRAEGQAERPTPAPRR